MADETKESVLRIPQVILEVTKVNNNLSDCSNNLLTVMSDSIAEAIMSSIATVLTMVEQIENATDEGAHGTTDTSGRINQVSLNSDEIKGFVDKVGEIMDLLEKYTNEVKMYYWIYISMRLNRKFFLQKEIA